MGDERIIPWSWFIATKVGTRGLEEASHGPLNMAFLDSQGR